MNADRQGDVSIIASKPRGRKLNRIADPVLARGEITGHAHRIIEGKVRLYNMASGVLYLRVLSEFAKLYHEEHEDVILPKGDYEVRRQREFDPLAGRRGEVRYGMD